MHEDIAEAGYGCHISSKFFGQHAQLAQPYKSFIIILGFFSPFQRDDPIADINAALGRNLKITFDNIT